MHLTLIAARRVAVSLAFLACCAVSLAAAADKPLQIYFIDVEGGQSTLVVTPAGDSMLIDTGWPGFENRDADRIAAAAHDAGLKQIDYVLITHYHRDHVGGAPQLAAKLKVKNFVDHGANQENAGDVPGLYTAYQKLWPSAKHIVVKPGDRIPLRGVNVEVLTAAGEGITHALPGAGAPNPLCASEPQAPEDPSENARSLGTLFTFGKFRFIDLGDLTKRKETALVCPNNLVGTVDLYLTTHHGLDQSNAKAIVDALHPRVAIMNNGPRKGGSPAAWQTVHDSPGLEDLWQLHTALDSDSQHNVDEQHIANPGDSDPGHYLKVTAHQDGSFTVLNSRNRASRTYAKR